MGDWDLLVRLKIEGETVAFDLVRSDGSGAYRVVCDLRTGSAWRESLPPDEARRLLDLAREDLAKLHKLKSGELESGPGLRLIVYDTTEGRILLELARPSLGFIRECNPRLAGLLGLLQQIGTRRGFAEWDFLRLSVQASEYRDLLEAAGLASTRLIRALLHTNLVLGTYLLTSGLGLAAFLPWIELLKRFPRLGEAPEFRWEPSTLLEYAERLAYAGILCGVEAAYWVCCKVAVEVLLRALGLWDYAMNGKVLELAGCIVWAPLFEEPTKRLMSALTGLPRWLVGLWYGLLEAVEWREIWPGALEPVRIVWRVADHIAYSVLPLPLGALLHSLWNVISGLGGEILEYWPGVLGMALAVLGALVENALTGVW